MHDPAAPQGEEVRKTRWRALVYAAGKGLDLGCGMEKLLDTSNCIGVDNDKDAQLYLRPAKYDIKADVSDLPFVSGRYDYAFSSHVLEHIPLDKVPATLAEWMRVLRVGGRLILYLPDADQYPKCKDASMGIEEYEPHCNTDHKWNVTYQRVVMAMEQVECGWELKHFEVCSEEDEYSLFFVFFKREKDHTFSWREQPPPEQPRAAVIRYGAFGDIAQGISVCTALKEQGYHVTFFTTYPASEIVALDPAIDRMVMQEQDQIPIQWLGHFWQWIEKKWMGRGFDKWVNLIESIESNLLAMPGNMRYTYPPRTLHKLMNFNYMEHIFDLAGLSFDPERHGYRFYPTTEERAWCAAERERMRALGIQNFIMWSLSGSSRVHKVYPHMEGVWFHVLKHYPEWGIVTVGAGDCAPLVRGPFVQDSRMWNTSGQWNMRQVLAMMEEADIVCGPETGLLSCAAYYPMPKVVLLSHSTVENLTKNWINTSSVYSPNTRCAGRGDNEVPACHKMLPTFIGCTKNEKFGVAQCTVDIKPAWVWDCLQHAMLTGEAKKWLP